MVSYGNKEKKWLKSTELLAQPKESPHVPYAILINTIGKSLR